MSRGERVPHVQLTHDNGGGACREDDHPGTCNVCNLCICKTCGGIEGALLPWCPDRLLTQAEHDANYATMHDRLRERVHFDVTDDSGPRQEDDPHERAAAQARDRDFEDTDGRDWT